MGNLRLLFLFVLFPDPLRRSGQDLIQKYHPESIRDKMRPGPAGWLHDPLLFAIIQ
ncbi:hypothetical protein [Algoriphagus terrigena]|uniref:hypothetical protein n=1 Tax=Algoriphagus terrigena TaxID=344884 RepID=UPI0003F8EC7A|nr:hypothetical protein [Algoriphagus terrigena]